MKGVCWARANSEPTTPNLTVGKWYMNTRWDEEGHVMWIMNDIGSECLIILREFDAQCAYLNSGNEWEVVRELPKV